VEPEISNESGQVEIDNHAGLKQAAGKFLQSAESGAIFILFYFKGESAMNLLRIASTLIFSLSLLAIPNVFAGDEKVSAMTRTMAEIMIYLRHYPSDADKEKLKKVAADTTASAHEKTIAQALLNLDHKPVDADRPRLEAITKDAAAPAAVKSLASILLSLNHKPTGADTEKLKQIAK
jgi:hypothetical protein